MPKKKIKKLKKNKNLKYQLALVLFISLGFGYLLWHSYYIHIDNVKDEDIPLIKSPSNIVSKPKHRGGLVIANKDKDIYNHISGKRRVYDRVKTIKLDEDNLSKSEALALINKQLKNGKIKKGNNSINHNNKSIFTRFFAKSYYLRVGKLTSVHVKDKALKILQSKYPDLKGLKGKLYQEKGKDGKARYYLHVGPIKGKTAAEDLCARLINIGKACKVFL